MKLVQVYAYQQLRRTQVTQVRVTIKGNASDSDKSSEVSLHLTFRLIKRGEASDDRGIFSVRSHFPRGLFAQMSFFFPFTLHNKK